MRTVTRVAVLAGSVVACSPGAPAIPVSPPVAEAVPSSIASSVVPSLRVAPRANRAAPRAIRVAPRSAPPAPAFTPPAAPGEEAAPVAGGARCIAATPSAPARTVLSPGPDPRCPPDPGGVPELSTGEVTFLDAGGAVVTVEIAESEEAQDRGLMYRRSMPEDRGMIFVFEEPDDWRFWMHDTCIPLDMVFVAADGLVVGIEENCRTMDDSVYSVGCPSSYVIELDAGFTRAHGVAAGQRVSFAGIP